MITVAVDIQVQASLAANIYIISGTVDIQKHASLAANTNVVSGAHVRGKLKDQAPVYPKDGKLYSAMEMMLAFVMVFHSRLGGSSMVPTKISNLCAELVFPHLYPM